MIKLLRRRRSTPSLHDLLSQRQFDQAVELCRHNMLADPQNNAHWQHQVGEILLLAERRDEGLDELVQSAVLYEQEARPLQAIATYSQVLRLADEHEVVNERLAGIANGGEIETGDDYTTGEFLGVSKRWRRCLPLFSLFTFDELVAVVRRLQCSWMQTGQAVFRPGDAASSLLAVASGEVVLTTETDSSRQVNEGEYFGGLLPDESLRSSTARTSRKTYVIELQREPLRQVAVKHPRVWDVVQAFQSERGIVS